MRTSANRKIRLALAAMLGAGLLGGAAPVAWAAPALSATDSLEIEAKAALAQRCSQMAHDVLRSTPFADPMWRQAIALHRASTRLAPNERRFWRLLVEAETHAGTTPDAIAALSPYLKLEPDDEWAWGQLLQLYTSRLEGADRKLEYLRSLIGNAKVPQDVRAHMATLAARLSMERSEKEAEAFVEQALQLNPMNPTALRMKYDLVARDAAPPQRLAALLALLRASPAQPWAIQEAARMFADAGIADTALDWYGRAFAVANQPGASDADHLHDLVIEYASQLFMAGKSQPAAKLAQDWLQISPDDPDTWFLRLLMERGSGDEGAWAKTLQAAEQALSNRWSTLATQAGQIAATQPAANDAAANDSDPAVVVRKVKATNNPGLIRAASLTATDLAWFHLYFSEQPAAAQRWIDVQRALMTQDATTINRLVGWSALLEKKPDEAKKLLTPLADVDPLAALGLARLEGKPIGAVFSSHRTGLLGLLLWQASKGEAAQPTTRPADAAALQTELARFPRNWLDILNESDAKRFYQLKIDPIRVATPYGEPMLVRVSLQNIGETELTLGDDGAVRRDLWFDASVLGPDRQMFVGAAFDRIAGPMRLKPGQAVGQIVRIDEGELDQLLSSNPTPPVQVDVTVTTNPTSNDRGVGPGPGGRRAGVPKRFARIGFNITAEGVRKKALDEAAIGLPASKMRYLDLLSAYAVAAQQPQARPEAQEVATAFSQQLAKRRPDDSPAVEAWAGYTAAMIAQPDPKVEIVRQMAQNSNWETRLMAMIVADTLPFEARKEIASQLADRDADPLVKMYAQGSLDLLNNPKTVPSPATRPNVAGAPATPKTFLPGADASK